MARTASFWSLYAEASDTARHELVEKPWFGKQTTADIDENDMPALSGGHEEPDEDQPNPYEPGPSVDQEEPFSELYGQDIEQPEPEQEP